MLLTLDTFEGFQAAYNAFGNGNNGRIGYAVSGGFLTELWATTQMGQLYADVSGETKTLTNLTDWHGPNVLDLSPGFTVTV